VQTLGIVVDPGAGKPKLSGVVLRGTAEEPVFVEDFELRASGDDPSEQAVDLALRLQAKISGLDFQAAAIRAAGRQPVANRRKAQFSRAHAEGAALLVLREHLKQPILTGNPTSFASLVGLKKDKIIEQATALSKSKADAAVAALAAFG
jgi:hypothetical protein